MIAPTSIVTVAAYAVSCLPDNHPLAAQFRLHVRRYRGSWVIEHQGEFLTSNQELALDPELFDTAEHALALATAHAPTMWFHGRQPADILQDEK
ncbi:MULTISPECIES: hypothetical protein [Nocardia]|uniref:hypothetical protein n=1 Tax=Nocardia TaxID=1817 RepID=UPI0024577492|nr:MULTISPECIES: hypothetical protein [Nocardia]